MDVQSNLASFPRDRENFTYLCKDEHALTAVDILWEWIFGLMKNAFWVRVPLCFTSIRELVNEIVKVWFQGLVIVRWRSHWCKAYSSPTQRCCPLFRMLCQGSHAPRAATLRHFTNVQIIIFQMSIFKLAWVLVFLNLAGRSNFLDDCFYVSC